MVCILSMAPALQHRPSYNGFTVLSCMHVLPKSATVCMSKLTIILQQGTGYWQHLPTVPKELLSRASALPVDEQQAAETEQTSQQQSLCIRSGFAPLGCTRKRSAEAARATLQVQQHCLRKILVDRSSTYSAACVLGCCHTDLYLALQDMHLTHLSLSLNVLLICPSMTYAYYAPPNQICSQEVCASFAALSSIPAREHLLLHHCSAGTQQPPHCT